MVSLRNSLQIRTAQTQTLTMTPQLQQAIRLLQLSTLDLKQEIQQTLESNPMLEVDDNALNPNIESLDALVDREQAQNSDGDVYNPFSDDPSACPSNLSSYSTNDDAPPPSTADVLGRDSSMYPEYAATNSFESDYSASSNATNDLGGGDAAASNFEGDASDYSDSDLASSNAFDGMSEADIDMAYDLEHLSSNSALESSNSIELNSNNSENDNLPDKLATAEIDPGEGSIMDSYDNIMREDNYSAKSRAKSVMTDDDGIYEGETQINLHEHLLWQLDCSPLQGRDRAIAETIIDGVDDSGYLSVELSEILDVVRENYPDASLDDVKVVLKLIQSYDPLGVAARDVQECLLIQLRDKLSREPSEEGKMAEDILLHHLSLLSNHDYRSLCTCLGVKIETLKRVNDIIVSLNPRPGRTVIKEKANYVVPDVIVIKDKDGNYDVELNPDALPRVKLNEQYKSLVCYARNEREKEFFKSNLQEANWFIQSIAKRNETLLKVSRCIVEHQKAFLDYGEQRMEPLVLNDIAQEIEMHESTISRVTTEKYIYTDRGTFELKYFFSSHVNTDNGGTASSTAIRAEIKLLVSRENPRRPYSDNQIANLLKEKGYCVARRTIAKYREALGIGSSSQRKRLV